MIKYKRLRNCYWICKKQGIQLIIYFGILSLLAWMMLWSNAFGIGRLEIIAAEPGLQTIQLNYTPEEAELFLVLLGEAGRTYVLRALLPIMSVCALIWILFCSLLMMCIFLLRRPLSRTPVGLWLLLIIPVLTVVSAAVELLTLMHVLMVYPDFPEFSLRLASSAALGRSVGFFSIFALMVIGLVSAGRRSP